MEKIVKRPTLRVHILLLMAVCGAAQEPLPGVQAPTQEVQTIPVPARVGISSEMPITLEDVIRQVLANNRAIAVSHVDVERARLTVDAASGAFDPVLGWQSTYEHQVTPVTSFLGGSSTGSLTQNTFNTEPQLSGLLPAAGTSYQAQFTSQRVQSNNQFLSLNPEFPTALAVSIVQPLFRNLAIDSARHQIQVAKKNVNLSAEQFRQQLLGIVAQAEQAYWQLAFAAKNLNVQLQGLELARNQANSNARRANAGTLAPIEIVEAETQVATSEQSVFQAQQQLTAAETQLKALMLPDRSAPLWSVGLTPATDFESSAQQITLEQALSQALANRPEISQSNVSVAINEIDVRFFNNQTRPEINLVGSYTASGLSGRASAQGPIKIPGFGSISTAPPAELVGGYGQSLDNLFRRRFPTAEVGVQFNLPLRNRTAKANLGTALAQGRQIKLQRQELEQSIAADVRNAMQQLASVQAEVKAAADGQRGAEEMYASEQRKFQAGTTTVFLLFQRQTSMITARSQLARAQADLSVAISQYEAAKGTTLSVRNINVQP